MSAVASGKKYFIVPVYILKHLHTVTLVQSQTIAIREPRDAGRLTQFENNQPFRANENVRILGRLTRA